MNKEFEPRIKTQRIDDLPLLYSQIERMGIPQLIDEYFLSDGNWQGLSYRKVLAVWLSHILSQEDHGLSYVQPWVKERLETLKVMAQESIKELDFSDDRLESALRYLSQDEKWLELESALGGNLVQVYDLSSERVPKNSTTASSYCGVEQNGLFEFGHSKDNRPDLRQVKIMLDRLDPHRIPIATEVVAGNQGDDHLYILAILKVKEILQKPELLMIGDCQMAALDTRAEIVRGSNYYLCPLSLPQVSRELLAEYVLPVWHRKQSITDIEYSYECPTTEVVAVGYERNVTQSKLIDAKVFNSNQRRLIVRSQKSCRDRGTGPTRGFAKSRKSTLSIGRAQTREKSLTHHRRLASGY